MPDTKQEDKVFPRHIGFIMDGNGRWAKKRGLPRNLGHRQGAKVFKEMIDICRNHGVEYATFYAFSTENWKRPKDEIDGIMKLLRQYLVDIRKSAQKNTRIIILGCTDVFDEDIKSQLKEIQEESARNTGLTVAIALNYGGRNEIVNAARQMAVKLKNGEISENDITESNFERYLYTKDMPPADMIIRPSGEMRTSNFLVWQGAYAELVFMDVLWPDFSEKDLMWAIEEYKKRNRRFGGL